MPSTAPTLPAVSASQAFTSSSDSLDSWEEPHPGLRRPYPPGTGFGLVDGAALGGCMDGMAAKRTRSYTRVRPWLPRRGAQHHTSAGSRPPLAQNNLSWPDTTSSSVHSNARPAVLLPDDAAEPLPDSQLPADVLGSASINVPGIHRQPAAFTESLLSESSHFRRLDADGDVATMSEPLVEHNRDGSQTDVYGWDAELDRQIGAGPRPTVNADTPCSCDLDYTVRRQVGGGKRSLLHRVFSLGSSTSDGPSVQVRRSASSST